MTNKSLYTYVGEGGGDENIIIDKRRHEFQTGKIYFNELKSIKEWVKTDTIMKIHPFNISLDGYRWRESIQRGGGECVREREREKTAGRNDGVVSGRKMECSSFVFNCFV